MENIAHNHEVKDPLGHTKLAVSDFAKSIHFYRDLFTWLGHGLLVESDHSAGWVSSEGDGFWIAQADIPGPAPIHGAPGFHHQWFKVTSSERVDDIHQKLQAAQVHIFDVPTHYPQYTKDYYAVFFADPDGMKLEVAYY